MSEAPFTYTPDMSTLGDGAHTLTTETHYTDGTSSTANTEIPAQNTSLKEAINNNILYVMAGVVLVAAVVGGLIVFKPARKRMRRAASTSNSSSSAYEDITESSITSVPTSRRGGGLRKNRNTYDWWR